MTNGTLNGISSMKRTDDALVAYSSETDRFGVHFPIDLNELYVRYFHDFFYYLFKIICE